MNTIAIKKEDKNKWERRAPIIPYHVKKLVELGITTVVEEQPNRAFSKLEYLNAGAQIVNDIADYPIVLGVKEIPPDKILPNKTYLFFSHTIKAQANNMPMLRKIVQQKCTLIDYECIRDRNNRRLVYFSRFAGIAGMIDSLSVYGKQLDRKGINNPFSKIKPAYYYNDLAEAQKVIKGVGENIKSLTNKSFLPLIIGITGYGQVSRGAQEILDNLPVKQIYPAELLENRTLGDFPINKVIFTEKDMFTPIDPKSRFDLQEYFNSPEKYRSIFEQYLSNLTILVNGIYWEKRYPRLVTKDFLRKLLPNVQNKLGQICDISCDINGSIECTEKATESDFPAFVYNPETGTVTDGIDGDGLVILAVDNLPAELPRDASEAFSAAIWSYIPQIVKCNMQKTFADVALSPEIKNAVIVYKGELTSHYQYLAPYL